MATKHLLVDDIDGTTGDVRTVHFGLDGKDYTIDLSPENQQQFRAVLAPYVQVSRNGGGKPVRHINGHTNGSSAAVIRRWATDNGITIGIRGRIPAEVRASYEAAKSQAN